MKEDFYSDFLPLSKAAQQAKIMEDLKKGNDANTLGWKNLEEIDIPALLHREEVKKSFKKTSSPIDWKITYRIPFSSDIQRLEEQIDWVSKQEVGVIFLEIGTHWQYLPKVFPQLAKLESKLMFAFDKFPPEDVIEQLSSIKNKQICVDPLGQVALQGGDVNGVSSKVQEYLVKQTPVYVDAALYANAGANCQQQIAYALLHLNEYLSLMDLSSPMDSRQLIVKFAQGSNYFFEMAKLIVFRQLTRFILAEYPLKITLELIAEPARRNKTCSDYNVNLLRSTTEMMSAILGQANMVINHPYDLRFNPNNDFSDRIALNQLRLLKHESYFDQLPNVIQGSYYLTYLIDQMKQKAWDLFLSHETAGGWIKQLSKNILQKEIGMKVKETQKQIESGVQVLVGTNKYRDENAPSAQVKQEQQKLKVALGKIQPLKPSFLK